MSSYRRNKYGKLIEVEKYSCGSCINYEFEREDEENYCKHFGKYYPYNDNCKNHWEDFEGSSGGCFLTTACCIYRGLPDDCYELTTLRNFRDNYLSKTKIGKQLIDIYYDNAPEIVEHLNKKENCAEIYDIVYDKIIDIIKLIQQNKYTESILQYLDLILYAEKESNI